MLPDPVSTIQFYKDGFFGYGESGNFQFWTLAHFIPLAILAVILFLIIFYREKLRNWKYERAFRFCLAALMILVEMSYYWRILYVGTEGLEQHLLTKLPLQVCEWTCILASFMMMSENRHLYAICFFTALTCSVIPLFYPSVIPRTGPAYYRYYQFWGEHMLPIIGVIYMTFVKRMSVKLSEIWKPAAYLLTLAFIAIPVNAAIPGANYAYLSSDPTLPGNGIAKIFPKNVWLKLLVYIAVVIAIFLLVYLVNYLIRKGVKKHAERKTARRVIEDD